MTLTPERAAALDAKLDAVVAAANAARTANELSAIKRALNDLWFTTHKAQEAVNDAEEATRREALAKIGEAA